MGIPTRLRYTPHPPAARHLGIARASAITTRP